MKRFLAVSVITLGLSFSVGAQDHTKPTKSSAQSPTPSPTPKSTRTTTRRRNRNTRKRAPLPPKVAATPWERFTSEAGRFSVLMPGIPNDKSETVDSQPGPYTSHLMTLRNPENVFLIGWVDYDPNFNFMRQSELEMNRDQFVEGIGAKLLSSRLVTIDGYRVLEFTAETAERSFKSRVFIVGRRPYQIVIGSPKGEEDTVKVNRFLNSFKVSPN